MYKAFIIFISLQITLSSSPINEKTPIFKNQNNTTKIDISDEINPLCNQFNCKEGNCFDNLCVCDYGYTTLKNSPTNIQCDYKKKERIIAVLLEFFFPIGIGHFYVGKYFTGLLKLSLFVIILLSISTGICFSYYSKNSVIAPFFILCLSTLIFVIWYLVDIVKFSFGYYLDGNGIELI
jgi:hypothetical protein